MRVTTSYYVIINIYLPLLPAKVIPLSSKPHFPPEAGVGKKPHHYSEVVEWRDFYQGKNGLVERGREY